MKNQKFKKLAVCANLIAFLFLFSSCTKQEKENLKPQEKSAEKKETPPPASAAASLPSSSEEIVGLAWEASHKGDLKRLSELVRQCLKFYGEEARAQQAQLSGFPPLGDIPKYKTLGDVGTCLFIRAEALMNNGQKEEAKIQFQEITDDYSWAQSWDPRGWYWSVAEKSQASIDVLSGKATPEDPVQTEISRTLPTLYSKGKENVIDYSKYGKFLNAGTPEYSYQIVDNTGLIKALGEGIYPNTGDIFNNPRYKEVRKEGRLKDKYWDYVNSSDLEAAYFKWVTAPEPIGVRLFYLGTIFEKAGMHYEALKAYHALVVHFPKTIAWTYWQTPWYPGQVAIAKIRHILRIHPELNLIEEGMKITIQNGYDNNIENDVITTYPGKIIPKALAGAEKEQKVPLENVKKTIGQGNIRLVQYENRHWQLLVDDKPYVIKGVTYAPTKVGQTPDKGTLKSWMEMDENNNGRLDGPYDSWVDANRDNKQNSDEPVVGDFQLMKELGVNTLRIFHQPFAPNKEVLRKMFNDYGIRVMMGDYLGKYAFGSGATWLEGTDYDNPEHRKNMLESVKKMVMEFKDEPYILMWLLGNENNYGMACNADKKPEAYYKFVNEVARWIKSVDKNHPVAVSNGDTLYLDIFAKNAPDVDVFAANVYRGDYGFGSFWEQVLDAAEKPAFITEYGCPAYAKHLTLEEGEEAQALYHKGNWLDIEENLAGNPKGAGNALGGIAFEWLDEWWKNYEPFAHDRKSDAIGPFPGGYYFEEWFGIAGQGDGTKSPYLRQLRKSYFVYKELWNK